MILQRLFLALLAAAVFAAAGGVAVVALAFAIYAFAEPRLGRAWAAASVAFIAMGFLALAGLGLSLSRRRRPARMSPMTAEGAVERIFAFVREKPILAVSAAIGAGLLSVRNPKYLGAAIRAFLDGEPPGT